jgi:hypothetical protein
MEYFYTLEKSHVPNRKHFIVYEKRPVQDGFFPGGKCAAVYNEGEKPNMKKDFPGIKALKLKNER